MRLYQLPEMYSVSGTGTAECHNYCCDVTSISVDDNLGNWKNALTVEKMNWRQLLVTDNIKKNFDDEYETGSLPDIIFINSKGEVIQRFIGYEDGQYEKYKGIIQLQLGK